MLLFYQTLFQNPVAMQSSSRLSITLDPKTCAQIYQCLRGDYFETDCKPEMIQRNVVYCLERTILYALFACGQVKVTSISSFHALNLVCPLCLWPDETHSHFFISCSVPLTIWNHIFVWLDFCRLPSCEALSDHILAFKANMIGIAFGQPETIFFSRAAIKEQWKYLLQLSLFN